MTINPDGLDGFSFLGQVLSRMKAGGGQVEDRMTSTTQSGWARYRSQAYQDALTDFTRALAEDPHDYSAALGAGRCHRLLAHLDDAVAAFSRAHEIRPEEARPPLPGAL